jgi:release factor glutamine methyltransferase
MAKSVYSFFRQRLEEVYEPREARAIALMVFDGRFGLSTADVYAGKDEQLGDAERQELERLLVRLLHHEPVQYVLGTATFCGHPFRVRPGVLIPRPETEEMVEWIVGSGQWVVGSILDLCTGSGCIAIALKKAFPQAEVTAVDVSSAALALARQNAENNGAEVHFVEGDVLDGVNGFNGSYGLIVCNPPYVLDSERAQMQPNVLDYDPALALFVPDDDPLRFYKAIAAIAKEHLAENGQVVVEINEDLAEETCAVFKAQGFTPKVHADFRGKPRWISADGAGARRDE